MADGMQISKLDNAVRELWKTTDSQQQLMKRIIYKLAAMDDKYEQLLQDSRQEKAGSSGNRQDLERSGGIQTRSSPIEVSSA